MEKVDFKKTFKDLYAPKKKFKLVDVPEMQFLMVDGHGDPNTVPSYVAAVETLFGVAYKLKFMSKKELEKDYTVPPLEGLWWAEDMDTFITRDKSAWDWTMMIKTPDWITQEMFVAVVAEVRAKKASAALDKLRLERYHEGLSVQIMHIGPYDEEASTIAALHNEFIPANGLTENGHHHEIYLSDPRKVAPEKLKTVLRQPVQRI